MISFLLALAVSAHLYPEKHYQQIWCDEQKGVMEYRLDDGARVDCLTDEYAIEFDFAPKWAESIGQSLYYSEKTRRKPGVVLIMEHDSDQRFLSRINKIGDKYGIMIWTVTP